MSETPILAPEAKADVEKAYAWYEEQSPGLGKEFLRCVEAALLGIQRNPLVHPMVHDRYRRALVRRFPFAIFFEFFCQPEPLRRLLGVPLLARSGEVEASAAKLAPLRFRWKY